MTTSELDRLHAFVDDLFRVALWQTGIEIVDEELEGLFIKHGLLTKHVVHEPCGMKCVCAEYNSPKTMAGGVTCYRRTQWEER